MIWLLLIAQLVTQVGGNTLVNGTFNVWTNGTYTWAGNPYCVDESGAPNFTLQPISAAIDAGVWIEGLHCPNPGPGPAQGVGYCEEWYGQSPDIGACEFVPQPVLSRPGNLGVTLQ